jgi:hypothetical protein
MIQKIGGRKTVWVTECLICFWVTLYTLDITDPSAILTVSGGIVAILGSAVYGNIKEHQANGKS